MGSSRWMGLIIAASAACGGSVTGEVDHRYGTADATENADVQNAEAEDASSAPGDTADRADSAAGSTRSEGAVDVQLDPDAPASEAALTDSTLLPDVPTWCQRVTSLFCSDFDRSPFDDLWDSRAIRGGGRVEEVATRFRSDPFGFQSTIPLRPYPFPDGAEARLVRDFPATGNHARLAFDLFVEPFDFYDQVPIGERQGPIDFVSIVRGSVTYRLFIHGDFNSPLGGPLVTRFEMDRPSIIALGYGTSPLSLGKWVHLDINVTYSEDWQVGVGELKFDGITASHIAYERNLYPATSISVYLGVLAAGRGPPISATYDNVTFDLDP